MTELSLDAYGGKQLPQAELKRLLKEEAAKLFGVESGALERDGSQPSDGPSGNNGLFQHREVLSRPAKGGEEH
jgi:hypothetical protein